MVLNTLFVSAKTRAVGSELSCRALLPREQNYSTESIAALRAPIPPRRSESRTLGVYRPLTGDQEVVVFPGRGQEDVGGECPLVWART
jgi:hypothetical protein